MKFFIYDNVNGNVQLNSEGLLVISEFANLLSNDRNKTKEDKLGKKKERAFREFTYIYLFIDWESPYFNFSEEERHKASLDNSKLSEVEFNDELFRAACKKYEEIQNENINLRMLKGCMMSVEKLIFYFENVDINERDPITGKPIYSSKDLISNIKNAKDLVISLQDLEKQVKKELEQDTGLRGGMEAGFYD